MEGNGGNSQTNLIINYLPQTLTDEEFRSLFTSIGPIKSSKVVRHKATGYSYGFGFVDYQGAGDAARAVETLNGLQLQNKKIKVGYARPGGETIKPANLYIRGIPKHFSPEQAEQAEKLFADFGRLIHFRVLKDDTGATNKGVAFALYELRENAEAAMAALTGQTLPGATEPLLIKFAEDNSKKLRPPEGQVAQGQLTGPPGAGDGPMCGAQGRCQCNQRTGSYQYPMGGMAPAPTAAGGPTLYVYNIETDTDENSLLQLFAQYGTVTKVNIIRDTATGLSKGFGFVTMANYQDCVRAIEALNGFLYADPVVKRDGNKTDQIYI